jgi:proline iminopeptidase
MKNSFHIRRYVMHPKYLRIMFSVICLVLISYSVYGQTKSIHPEGKLVNVNGAKLWVEIEGKGEPLLIIPGGPGDSHYFHPSFSVLASSVQVICFDAFGRGKSDRAVNKKEYTFNRDVEDIEGLRKALGFETINLLGHSYGGMVAQEYALRYPEHVKRLILSNTLFNAEMWQANNDNCNYELKNQYPEIWDSLMIVRALGYHSGDKIHYSLYGEVPIGLFYFYDASKAGHLEYTNNPDVYYSIAGYDCDFLIGGDMTNIDFRTKLKDLKMPLLIIAGRFDRVALPRFSIQFKKYAPQAEYVWFEKSGHQPFVEEPDKYFKVVREFLSGK